MPREQWEKGTFGGHHNSPRNPTRGHSQEELRQRASFDNEPQTGCGALLMVAVLCIISVIMAVAS